METDVKDRKIILNGTPAWLHLYKRTVVVYCCKLFYIICYGVGLYKTANQGFFLF